MKYEFVDQKVVISLDNREVSLNCLYDLIPFRISINPGKSKVAVLGSDQSQLLQIFNLYTGDFEFEIAEAFHDFQWKDDENILYSDGRSVVLCNVIRKESKQLVKFSRIKIAPIGLSVSPKADNFAFIKWKGNDKKICTYNFETETVLQYKQSLYRYCWLNNDQILYHLGAEIKILDIKSSKSVTFLKSLEDCFKKVSCFDVETRALINEFELLEKRRTSIGDPILIEEELYLRYTYVTNSGQREGVLSFNLKFENLKIHIHQENLGCSTEYFVFNDCKVVGLKVIPETKFNENIVKGYIYVQNNKLINFNKYKSTWLRTQPT